VVAFSIIWQCRLKDTENTAILFGLKVLLSILQKKLDILLSLHNFSASAYFYIRESVAYI
jgi:hypothetical protein